MPGYLHLTCLNRCCATVLSNANKEWKIKKKNRNKRNKFNNNYRRLNFCAVAFVLFVVVVVAAAAVLFFLFCDCVLLASPAF